VRPALEESDAVNRARGAATLEAGARQAVVGDVPPHRRRSIRIRIGLRRMAEAEDMLSIGRMESEIPDGDRPKRKEYELELMRLQIEMLKLQLWVKETGERVVILFEGRDAAGKGGAIRRFTEHVNPRGARVVALPIPTEVERTQWYLQRYVAHLPAGGEIVFFDRSWYNRAGVERVMGYATEEQVELFYEQVPAFERQLADSGIRLFKLWFTVSQAEQYRRFEDRKVDPLKQWKLSPNDEASIKRFSEYGAARDDMLRRTDLPEAPWTVVNSNVKRRARLESMRHVLHELPYRSKDESVVRAPDPRVVQPAAALDHDGD
jgi:polyphosphate kinase 2